MTITIDQVVGRGSDVRARPAGFVTDTLAIAGRALRAVPRDLEAVIPPIFIALFFFVVNIATLSNLTETGIPGFDFKAFQLPTAILLGVTGVSRAPALVLDVQNAMRFQPDPSQPPVRHLAIIGLRGASRALRKALTAFTPKPSREDNHAFADASDRGQ